jgi:hypothetical protein
MAGLRFRPEHLYTNLLITQASLGCIKSIIVYFSYFCLYYFIIQTFSKVLKCPMLAFLYAYFICCGPRYSDVTFCDQWV